MIADAPATQTYVPLDASATQRHLHPDAPATRMHLHQDAQNANSQAESPADKPVQAHVYAIFF